MDSLAAGLQPLAGGWSGETFMAEAGGERSVVRIYGRTGRPDVAPEIDAAVLALVRGLVPVPDVLEVRPGDTLQGDPGLLVTSWLSGERGDLVLDRAGDDDLERFGRAMGHVAGTLAGMPMLRPGPFIDADLRIGDFPDGGLAEWVDTRLTSWSATERARLVEVVKPAQDRLDTVSRTCLVHSDLNPKNVLLDPVTREITGVLDWEFAHAGHPWTDVGNLLRFDRHGAYVRAVLRAWADLRDATPSAVLEGARAADLWALIDLAARAAENPVTTRAEKLLREIARCGDVHAWPSGC